jgi:hypothetical protein
VTAATPADWKRIRLKSGSAPVAPVAGKAVTCVALGLETANGYHAVAEAGTVNTVTLVPASST